MSGPDAVLRPAVFLKRGMIRRMAGFLAPHRRLVVIASILIPLCIGLELSLPVITRTAIDRYLVPYHVHVHPEQLDTSLQEALNGALPHGLNPKEIKKDLFIREGNWRKLDPALTARIRAAGGVSALRYYVAPATAENDELISRHPGVFQRRDADILIAEKDLKQLPAEDLKTIRRADACGLISMALLFSFLAVALLGASYIQSVCLERAGQLMMKDVRAALFHHILTRSQAFFSDNPAGRLVTRMNNDVQSMAELFRHMVTGLFKELFLFIGITGVMFALNARLAMVCMLIVPPMALLAWYFAKVSKQIFHRIKACTGQVNTGLQESIAGIDTIRLLGAQSMVMEKLIRTNNRYFRAGLAQTKMFAVFTPLMELLGSLGIALIIWHGGFSVIHDRLSLGTLVAFLTYIQMLLVPIRGLSDKYNQLQGAVASTERIFILLDDPRRLETAGKPGTGAPNKGTPNKGDIKFHAVDFGYHTGRKILDNFNLFIPQGQTVTLVGPSGGGKSTLVNLLLRLYDPMQGEISLGGTPLTAIPSKDLVKQITLVSQEMILLAADIRENILLGRSGIPPDMVDRAIEISGVDTWVNTLPQGIHTRIGEGGRKLSQGQCQMLALARALAGDPRILILDEAFSQIDPESEQLIQSRLPSIMAGRTCITVAHRLASARYAHRILVIREGQVIEDGDHYSLMDARGVYADMVTLERCRL